MANNQANSRETDTMPTHRSKTDRRLRRPTLSAEVCWSRKRHGSAPGALEYVSIAEAAEQLGLSSPRSVQALLNHHELGNRIQHDKLPRLTVQYLAKLPEVRRIREMATLKDLGEELTDKELQELSSARPGQLPWHHPN